MKGRLYLIPVTLGTDRFKHVIPDEVLSITRALRHFIVEDIRSARRYLRNIDRSFPIDDSSFNLLNEHTRYEEIETYISILLKGNDVGLMSEAGIPCVADPGSPLIRMAHKNSISVVPLTGPSSLMLALMASGLNGQEFSFNGYLPIKSGERQASLRQLDKEASKGVSQIFIEAPYRNQKMLEDIIQTCRPERLLCLAVDISMESEYIRTSSILEWKKKLPSINKRPAIFILG